MSTSNEQQHASAYRAMLLEALEQRCQRNARYSQRAFARDIGVAPHRVSEILRGRQGLSRARAEHVAKQLGMDTATKTEFCERVAAAHGRSRAERLAAEGRLKRLKATKSKNKQLATARFKTLAAWYHLAIMEALKLSDCEPTVAGLAARLKIAPAQTQAALTRLESLELVRSSDSANSTQVINRHEKRYEPVVDSTIGGDIPSEAVRSFHDEYLNKAKDALVLQKLDERDFNTLIAAVDRSRLPEIRERLAQFIETLNNEFSVDMNKNTKADAVYAFTLHTFRIDHN